LREISSRSLWMPPSLRHMRELSRKVRQTLLTAAIYTLYVGLAIEQMNKVLQDTAL